MKALQEMKVGPAKPAMNQGSAIIMFPSCANMNLNIILLTGPGAPAPILRIIHPPTRSRARIAFRWNSSPAPSRISPGASDWSSRLGRQHVAPIRLLVSMQDGAQQAIKGSANISMLPNVNS